MRKITETTHRLYFNLIIWYKDLKCIQNKKCISVSLSSSLLSSYAKRMTLHEHHVVSNHRQLDWLFNSLFKLATKLWISGPAQNYTPKLVITRYLCINVGIHSLSTWSHLHGIQIQNILFVLVIWVSDICMPYLLQWETRVLSRFWIIGLVSTTLHMISNYIHSPTVVR